MARKKAIHLPIPAGWGSPRSISKAAAKALAKVGNATRAATRAAGKAVKKPGGKKRGRRADTHRVKGHAAAGGGKRRFGKRGTCPECGNYHDRSHHWSHLKGEHQAHTYKKKRSQPAKRRSAKKGAKKGAKRGKR